MKIIDLLNKIANGEEVPKKIKYENRILYLEDEAEEYEPTFNYYDKDGNNPLFEGWIGQYLNDEVEIIEDTPEEENKIPEKLEDFNLTTYSRDDEDLGLELHYTGVSNTFNDVYFKINEIIDYLKSKGDE